MLQFRKNTADILKDLIQFYHDCIKMLHFERGKGAGDRNLLLTTEIHRAKDRVTEALNDQSITLWLKTISFLLTFLRDYPEYDHAYDGCEKAPDGSQEFLVEDTRHKA